MEDAKRIQDTLASIQPAPPSSSQEAIVISDNEETPHPPIPSIALDTHNDYHDSSGSTKRQPPSPSSTTSDHDQDDDFRPVKIPRIIQQQQQRQRSKEESNESQPIQLDDGEELHEFLKRVEAQNKSRPRQRVPKIFVGSRTYVWIINNALDASLFMVYIVTNNWHSLWVN